MGFIVERRPESSAIVPAEHEEEVSGKLQKLGAILERLSQVRDILEAKFEGRSEGKDVRTEDEDVLVMCLKELGHWCSLASVGFGHAAEPPLQEKVQGEECGGQQLCVRAAALEELQRALEDKEASLQAAKECWEQEKEELEGRLQASVKAEEQAQRLVKHLKQARVQAVEEGEERLQEAVEEGRRREARLARMHEQALSEMAESHREREVALIMQQQSNEAHVQEEFQRREAAMLADFRRRNKALRRELDLKVVAVEREQRKAADAEERLRELQQSGSRGGGQTASEAGHRRVETAVGDGEKCEKCTVLGQLDVNVAQQAGSRPAAAPEEDSCGRLLHVPQVEAPPLYGFAAVLDRLKNIPALEEHTSAYIEELGGDAWYYGSQMTPGTMAPFFSHEDPDAEVGFPEEYCAGEGPALEGRDCDYGAWQGDLSIIPYSASPAGVFGRWGGARGLAETGPYTCTWARAADCC